MLVYGYKRCIISAGQGHHCIFMKFVNSINIKLTENNHGNIAHNKRRMCDKSSII